MKNSKQSLSSSSTFFCKFILPLVWFGVFGGAIIVQLFQKPDVSTIFALLMTIGVGVIYYFSCLPLKVVKLDNNYLYISNYRYTIQVPFSQIEDVWEIWKMSPHFIWIKFKVDTEFGRQIIFLAQRDLRNNFSSHPAVNKLRQLGGLKIIE